MYEIRNDGSVSQDNQGSGWKNFLPLPDFLSNTGLAFMILELAVRAISRASLPILPAIVCVHHFQEFAPWASQRGSAMFANDLLLLHGSDARIWLNICVFGPATFHNRTSLHSTNHCCTCTQPLDTCRCHSMDRLPEPH